MKNKLLIAIATLLITSQISKAQTEKGNQTLGMDAGFIYTKANNAYSINTVDNSFTNSTSKTTNFNIGPNYSYFIADKVDIGASLTYSLSNITNFDSADTKQSSHSYGGTIYLRKYFMYQDKIGLRAGLFTGYNRNDSKIVHSDPTSIYNTNSKTDNYSAGANLAIVYYPSKNSGSALR